MGKRYEVVLVLGKVVRLNWGKELAWNCVGMGIRFVMRKMLEVALGMGKGMRLC